MNDRREMFLEEVKSQLKSNGIGWKKAIGYFSTEEMWRWFLAGNSAERVVTGVKLRIERLTRSEKKEV